MPATRSERERGSTPIGERVPCGVKQRHAVSHRHAELAGKVLPQQDAGSSSLPSSSVRGARILEAPFQHRAAECR
jgi:hypothetical protein